MPWRHCIFTDTGVVFPPCPPLKTQPSRPCGSGTGPHPKDKPSRDIHESLEQMKLVSATASAATTPIPAPDFPAASPLPCAVERAPLPAKLATGWLQHDEKMAIFERSPSFKLTKMATFEKPSSFKRRLGECTLREAQASPEGAVA